MEARKNVLEGLPSADPDLGLAWLGIRGFSGRVLKARPGQALVGEGHGSATVEQAQLLDQTVNSLLCSKDCFERQIFPSWDLCVHNGFSDYTTHRFCKLQSFKGAAQRKI